MKEISFEKIDTTDMNIPVEHSIIDFHPLLLRGKIEYLQKDNNSSLAFYPAPSVMDVLFKINQKYGYDIKNHLGMKRLISTQFIDSQRFFKKLSALFFVGFFLPFVFQIQLNDQP